MLNWAQQFGIFCFLDNHDYNLPLHEWDCLLAADALEIIDGTNTSLKSIDDFLLNSDWVFGHIAYEALHHQYGIKTNRTSHISFSPFFFFKPRYLLKVKDGILFIDGPDAASVYTAINEFSIEKKSDSNVSEIKAGLSKESYISVVNDLLDHIHKGDCYEINFCQEFFASASVIDPLSVYMQLAQLAPNPYAAFYKVNDNYLICASPERFLSKKGDVLISQPMKGTAQRVPGNKEQDAKAKGELFKSQKDRSENVMVVDMVRNDLSRICKNVAVTELFGIQSFPYVHQMVSTISGTLNDDVTFSAIVEATFPMGSMTGAPKKRVMQLIEKYEPQKRGIFSGALGYFTSTRDFDFNVVIRSIMYNQASEYLSYQVGSGITTYSNPDDEWEECLLKAEAIKKVLTNRSALP